MPDKRTHRGPNPADEKLFSKKATEVLRSAVADFSLFLTKGYAPKSALKLVGDRFNLTQRQRLAVMRTASSDEQRKERIKKCMTVKDCAENPIAVDGYNLLITIEAAMSGGCIFKAPDGCFKDLASIHGTYRKVDETIPAIELIGNFLKENNIKDCLWLLDSPVSNSARLKTLIEKIAGDNDWQWQVKLSLNPDAELIKTDRIITTSDSIVLDGCKKWVNLSYAIIDWKLPQTWIIDLS